MKKFKILKQIPSSIWMLGFVSLLMDLSSEMIHSILPLFMVTVLHASALTIGIIEGVAESTALIVKVFSGVFSDFLGQRKNITVIGYGLSALTKPLFMLASSLGIIGLARFCDRIGKGIRGAPRDALIADIAPINLRGASFGLRQSLDTIGALLGPLIAFLFLFLFSNHFQFIFAIAIIPACLAVTLLILGVQEPEQVNTQQHINPLSHQNLKRLPSAYWGVVIIGSIFTLARFSEAFLILRAQQNNMPLMFIPLVLVIMNLVYVISAYPFGKLSDHMSHVKLLGFGLIILIFSDNILAVADHWPSLLLGIGLWGLHMGITQGLLARMIADTAPIDLRGTAYGFFNLSCGLSTLFASGIAGLLWETWGASFTFYASAIFSGLALIGLLIYINKQHLSS